ncbi:hypothetical protein PV797_02270 [Clostridiaceae bacterium M8S5]|nr:hypothetical protein PV797_02270 [Clostridiaceae bacterium M8S5]
MLRYSAYEMVKIVGEYWGKNDGKEFEDLFSEDAIIDHPFFSKEVSPQTVVEVLNSTVCGQTFYDGFELISGDGTGVDDVIKMSFIDTGDNAGYKPKYSGKMIIDAYIKDHKFTRFKVHGYDIVADKSAPNRITREIKLEDESTTDLARMVGEAWMSNDMSLFLSLFDEEATIYHPLFNEPITPEIAADVLNSAMEGLSIAHKPKIVKGDGSGKEDTVDMYFDETGMQLGYLPDNMGTMHITGRVQDNKFVEFLVHGYTVCKSNINIETVTSITKEIKEKELIGASKDNTINIDINNKSV